MPTVSIEAMNKHLAEISQCVSLGAIALLILDGAGWHGSPRLVVPDNIVLLPLPPYAPELNSVENIWEYLRSNWFSHCVWDTYEAILDACCDAWTQAGGMDRQTLRDWVIRYNTDGLAGLADRPRPGRQPRLAEAQRREVAKWVEDGPNLKTDGVVRWRCADLRDRIAAKFDVHLHERSVGKLLKKLNFSSMSGRPMHPQSDLEAQAAFKKTSPDWRAPQSRGSLPAGRSKSGFRMKPASASKAR